MMRAFVALTIVLAAVAGGPAPGGVGLVPAALGAVLSAQAMYADALAKEQAVRKAIAGGMAPASLGRAVRTVLAAYEAVVRQHPTSEFSDDALWRAARLATDVAVPARDASFQATASRYVRRLVSEYPHSTYARKVPETSPSADTIRASARTGAGTAATPMLAPPAPAVKAATTAAGTAVVPIATSGIGPVARDATTSTPSMPPAPVKPPSSAPATPTTPPAVAAAASLSPVSPQASTTRPVSPPPPTGEKARLLAIHRTVLPDVVRITLDIDQEATFRYERLSGPDRIFFDFARTTTARSLAERTIRFDQDTDVVRQVRIGQQSSGTTRVVLDAIGVASCSASPLYAPYRLVIDCVRSSAAATAAAAASERVASGKTGPSKTGPSKTDAAASESRPRPLTPATFARRTPAATPVAATVAATPTPGTAAATVMPAIVAPPAALAARQTMPLMAAPAVLFAWRIPTGQTAPWPGPAALSRTVLAALTAEASATPEAVATIAASLPPPTSRRSPPVAAPVAPARNLDGGLSIARQLGLSVSRIVIDPGHGGHDPGAKGAGTTEAAVVLDIALRLEKLLLQEAGIDVILTRRTDDFVPLEERTAVANREGADLFLSIHANASATAQAAGVETYFLNFARDRSAAAVAARENAASGKPMSALPDVVKAIAMNGKLEESRDFATQVQRALVQRLKPAHQHLRDLGVKQAPFVVLVGAAMPSVLAEVSFMTNEQEARLLKAQNYRQRIAEALFAAVQRYQGSLTRVPDVTGQ